YGIYQRDGALLSNGTLLSHGDLGSLTGLPVSELSDPQIVWDPGAQRFYYTVLDINRYGFAFGYSKSANPSSAADDFCHYILDYGYGSTLSLPDYPKMAVTNDFVLIGANIFYFSSIYNGSDLDWIQKPTTSICPASIAGGRFAALKNSNRSLTSTPVPAVNADPSSVGWVVGSADVGTGSANFLSVFKVTKDVNGNAAISSATSIPVAPYSMPASARQAGTADTLDTLDSRLEHAVAGYDQRIGATGIWTAHAVFGGAGSEERWYEISTAATPRLNQSGAVSSNSFYAWNGAISPNRANDGAGRAAYGSDAVMGVNTSSASAYAAIQMVSKQGSNPQSGLVLIKQSTGPNIDFTCTPNCRWGDYSGATPDPVIAAGGQVWLSGEWNLPSTNGSATVWQTWNWSASP
ncbi:MAG TPA: hypothetical protein VIM30_17580, partial [Candidatus Limnocylindrales bacterium]